MSRNLRALQIHALEKGEGAVIRSISKGEGKRIHISVTLYKREKDEAVARPSLIKRLRRSSLEVEETDPNLAHMG
jgi:hypothetical protein